jgi:hypothetical protein
MAEKFGLPEESIRYLSRLANKNQIDHEQAGSDGLQIII